MRTRRPPLAPPRASGAATVEFALLALLFVALVMAVIEFAHVMYVYSSAIAATRLGARVAVVCASADAGKVKARMATILPLLQPSNIVISYPAPGCSAATCEPVTVSIQNVTVTASIPMLPLTFNLPPFSTSMPAESLDSTDNGLCA